MFSTEQFLKLLSHGHGLGHGKWGSVQASKWNIQLNGISDCHRYAIHLKVRRIAVIEGYGILY
jgi:hypothetical protein